MMIYYNQVLVRKDHTKYICSKELRIDKYVLYIKLCTILWTFCQITGVDLQGAKPALPPPHLLAQ